MDIASSRRWLGLRIESHPEDRALTSASVPAVMLSNVAGGGAVTPSSALGVADVWACVRVLSDAASSVPLIPYRCTDTGRRRAEGSLAALLRRPAPATTQASLIGQTVAHLTLYGNAYVGKFRDIDGHVDQLALLHPERVTPELMRGQPRYTVRDPRGTETVHGPEDVLHIRAPLSIDGLTGLVRRNDASIELDRSRLFNQDASEMRGTMRADLLVPNPTAVVRIAGVL